MSDEQTTKEILKERLTPGEHIPLYNPEALKKIEKEFDRWKNTVVGEGLLKAAEKAGIKEHTVFLLGGYSHLRMPPSSKRWVLVPHSYNHQKRGNFLHRKCPSL